MDTKRGGLDFLFRSPLLDPLLRGIKEHNFCFVQFPKIDGRWVLTACVLCCTESVLTVYDGF